MTCREPAHFFRGLNYLLHHLEENFELEETSYFKKNGFMLDCSRNAVATVQTVKKLIQIMAKAGMNQLFLYTEDTYEVPGFPYFGTYRGRYSQEELREMDNYAALFGIELIPCIQTLSHLVRNFLKWPEAEPLKDSSDILLVGSEKVYDFHPADSHFPERLLPYQNHPYWHGRGSFPWALADIFGKTATGTALS